MFCFGARTRCCTTWRGTATGRKLPAGFKSMGCIRVFGWLSIRWAGRRGRAWISVRQFLGSRGRDGPIVPLPVGSEIIKPILLGQAVQPMFLRDLLAWQPLTETRCHGFELRQGRAADGCIPGLMALHQLADEVRALEHDAAARVFRRKLAKIS